jgi:hypothetical protein
VPSLKPSRWAIALFERPPQAKFAICCSRSDNPGRRSTVFLRSASRAIGVMGKDKGPRVCDRSRPPSSKLLAIRTTDSNFGCQAVTQLMSGHLASTCAALVVLKTSFNDLTRFTLLVMINSRTKEDCLVVLDANLVDQPPRDRERYTFGKLSLCALSRASIRLARFSMPSFK